MADVVPRNVKEILSCAEKKNWALVFHGLGCVLDLKNRHEDQDVSWEELIQAFKSDFWDKNIPLDKHKRNGFEPMKTVDLINRDMFKSLRIKLVNTGVKLSEDEELQMITLALKEDNWAAITAIYFFFCGPDSVSSALAEATEKAVQTRDWRFVDAVAVEFMKYHLIDNEEFLEILGLCDFHKDKEKAAGTVRNLLGNEDWDTVVLEICLKAIATWCLKTYEVGDNVSSWTAVVHFMEEFQCETEVNIEYLAKCLEYSSVDDDAAEEVLVIALEEKKMYFLRGVKYQVKVTQQQASKVLVFAHAAREWEIVHKCLDLFDVDDSHITEGEPVLFIALRINQFQLSKDLLPADINAPHQGYTLLHTAVDRWQENSSGFIVPNIICLMENDADINIKDPAGRTVLQKLVDKSRDQSNQPYKQRTQLILSAVNSAAVLDRAIDWTHVPDSEWNALHVLCDEGEFDIIPRLLQMKANPFEHRQGLTLLDTAILSQNHGLALKLQVCRFLVQNPDLVKDHVETVLSRSRPVIEDTQYRFPLIYLLQLTQSYETYFRLIKILHEHKVFAEAEYHQAIEEPMMSSLQILGLDDVIRFLKENAGICKPE